LPAVLSGHRKSLDFTPTFSTPLENTTFSLLTASPSNSFFTRSSLRHSRTIKFRAYVPLLSHDINWRFLFVNYMTLHQLPSPHFLSSRLAFIPSSSKLPQPPSPLLLRLHLFPFLTPQIVGLSPQILAGSPLPLNFDYEKTPCSAFPLLSPRQGWREPGPPLGCV